MRQTRHKPVLQLQPAKYPLQEVGRLQHCRPSERAIAAKRVSAWARWHGRWSHTHSSPGAQRQGLPMAHAYAGARFNAPSATSASVKNLRQILQSCLASLLSKTGSGLSADPPDRNNDPFKASVCRSKGPGSRVRLLSRTGGGSRTATLRETAARSSASPCTLHLHVQHAACTARRHPTHLAPGVL